MKNIINTSQGLFAAFGGYLGWWLGGQDGFIYALTLFVITDYLTGVFVAICEKNISSAVGFRGLFKKVLIFGLVGIANSIDHLFGIDSIIRTAVIFFYISNEGISIIENSAKLGLPVPQKLKDVLKNVKMKGEK